MILISAGHHPLVRGAHHGDFHEHDEAVLWRDELVALLGSEAAAVPVPDITPMENEPLATFVGRVCAVKAKFINAEENVRLAVEVHFNSLDTTKTLPSERGCLTYYYPGSQPGRRMAQRVQEVLRKFFLPDLGAHDGYVRMDKTQGIIWFLRDTKCPALLIEPQFIDRKEDIQAKRSDCCIALATVLMEIHDNLMGG